MLQVIITSSPSQLLSVPARKVPVIKIAPAELDQFDTGLSDNKDLLQSQKELLTRANSILNLPGAWYVEAEDANSVLLTNSNTSGTYTLKVSVLPYNWPIWKALPGYRVILRRRNAQKRTIHQVADLLSPVKI